MDFHPLADLFPLIEGPDFDALVADVKAHGLRHAITRHEGKILDGRNRFRACEAASVAPVFVDFDGTDPLAFVLSENLRRRHLTESQRAMVAARLANMRQGERTDLLSIDQKSHPPVSAQDAADMLNVGVATVNRAKQVINNAVPEVVAMVDRGELKVHAAREISSLPPAQQQKLATEGPKAIKKAAANKDRSRPCRNGSAKKKARTKTKASDAVVDDAVHAVDSLLEKWESIGGIKKLVAQWENQKRWTFSDKLAALSRHLRRLSAEVRDHKPQTV